MRKYDRANILSCRRGLRHLCAYLYTFQATCLTFFTVNWIQHFSNGDEIPNMGNILTNYCGKWIIIFFIFWFYFLPDVQTQGRKSTAALENTHVDWMHKQRSHCAHARTHAHREKTCLAPFHVKTLWKWRSVCFEVDLNLTEIAFTFCGSGVIFEN